MGVVKVENAFASTWWGVPHILTLGVRRDSVFLVVQLTLASKFRLWARMDGYGIPHPEQVSLRWPLRIISKPLYRMTRTLARHLIKSSRPDSSETLADASMYLDVLLEEWPQFCRVLESRNS